jgi:preprotein translocase subunit SecD
MNCRFHNQNEVPQTAGLKANLLMNPQLTPRSSSHLLNGEPQILITLTDAAPRQLGHITEHNVSRRLAIIFDGKILLAPRIHEKIVGKRW